MKTQCFATIITPDFIGYVLALRESLLLFNTDAVFYVMVSEREENLKETIESKYNNLFIVFADDLCKEGIGKQLFEKYHRSYIDGFRWSMKPVLLKYLLTEKGHTSAIFLDPDLFFFSDPAFLFDHLKEDRILLTPHWRSNNPFRDENNFQKLFHEGHFNAGFVGVNAKAIEILDWWANTCLFHCAKDNKKALYVDQGYLNLVPIYFEGARIIKQKGCNVAEWSRTYNERRCDDSGVPQIGGDPLVFIHFTAHTIEAIAAGGDPVLAPCLDQYDSALRKYEVYLRFPPPAKHSLTERILSSPFLKPIKKLKRLLQNPQR